MGGNKFSSRMAVSNFDGVPNVDQLVQITQNLWEHQVEGIDLEEDEEIVRFLNSLAFVGKILVDRVVTKNAVRSVLQCSWDPRLRVTITNLEDNFFLFKFNSEEDIRRVWNGGP